MTEAQQIWLWISVVLITNTITAVVLIDTYRRRIFSLKRAHAQENEATQQQLTNVRMKSRVLDAVPVSRLIENGGTE